MVDFGCRRAELRGKQREVQRGGLELGRGRLRHEGCIKRVTAGRTGGNVSTASERSHRGIGFDYQAAIADPGRQFVGPEEIRLYPWLTVSEKQTLLSAWAHRLEQEAKRDTTIRLDQPSGLYGRIGFELHALGTVRTSLPK
jgi:hypothetical protein